MPIEIPSQLRWTVIAKFDKRFTYLDIIFLYIKITEKRLVYLKRQTVKIKNSI